MKNLTIKLNYFIQFLLFLTFFDTVSAACCPGGVWSKWRSPDSCPKSCGSCATHIQTRTCLSVISGCPCTGDNLRTVPCNNKPCAAPLNSCCGSYKAHAYKTEIVCAEVDNPDTGCAAPPTEPLNSCPKNFTLFQENCYIALSAKSIVTNGIATAKQYQDACAALNAMVTSIHNKEENEFVADLAGKSDPNAMANYIRLTITHSSGEPFAPVNTLAWLDNTPVDYGNTLLEPWKTRGNYPWTPQGKWPAQPDNMPANSPNVIQWLKPAPSQAATWDDEFSTSYDGTTVCKI